MARPRKKGLDYIPLDVHFFDNKKIRKLNAKYNKGIASFVFLTLTCEIAQEGFYLKLSEDDLNFYAKESGISKKTYEQIIDDLIENGFFDKDLYKEHRILTSEDIQNQFFSIKNSKSKVELSTTEMAFVLVDLSNYKNVFTPKNDNEKQANTTENEPETVQKATENRPRTNQKQAENEPKTNPKITENEPETHTSKVKKSKVKKRESKVKEFSVQKPTENYPLPFLKIIEMFPEELRPSAENDFQKWFEAYQKLKENLSENEIEMLVNHAFADDFWSQNVTSLPYFFHRPKSDGVEIWKKIKRQMQSQQQSSINSNPTAAKLNKNFKIIGL